MEVEFEIFEMAFQFHIPGNPGRPFTAYIILYSSIIIFIQGLLDNYMSMSSAQDEIRLQNARETIDCSSILSRSTSYEGDPCLTRRSFTRPLTIAFYW